MAQFKDFLKNKDYLTLLEEVFTKRTHTMDELLSKLNERAYVLQPWGIIEQHIEFKVRPKHENLCYLVKRTYFKKDKPEDDEFDYSLIIGMDYIGKKRTIIPIYLRGELLGIQKLEWPHHHTNFKERKAGAIFPGYLTYDERKIWRRDFERVLAGKEPSEFYLKHLQAIKDLNPTLII